MITNVITYSVTNKSTDEQGLVSRYLTEHTTERVSLRKMTHAQARKALAHVANLADVVRIETVGKQK